MSDLRFLSTEELFKIPKPKWLIKDFVAENSTTMIYGPWGLGKSFMTLDMMLSATTGGEWYGERRIDRPLKTMYVVAEGAAWWIRRILAYERARQEIDHENMIWVPQPVNLWGDAQGGRGDLDQLMRGIEKHEPDILVIDTWVRCTAAYGMNEDKATDTARVYGRIDALRDEFGVAPVLVHHPKKTGGARGSGNQEASVERVISLEEVKNRPSEFDVADEKGNHMEPFDTFRMRFESVDLSDLSDTEELSSAVVRYEGVTSSGKLDNASVVYNAIVGMGTMKYGEIQNMRLVPSGSLDAALKKLVDTGKLSRANGEYDVV